jgi:hypothetical protein
MMIIGSVSFGPRETYLSMLGNALSLGGDEGKSGNSWDEIVAKGSGKGIRGEGNWPLGLTRRGASWIDGSKKVVPQRSIFGNKVPVWNVSSA